MMKNNLDKIADLARAHISIPNISFVPEIPKYIREQIDMQKKIDGMIPKGISGFLKSNDIINSAFPSIPFYSNLDSIFNSSFLQVLKSIANIEDRLKNDPEIQFHTISELKAFTLRSTSELREVLIKDLEEEDISIKEEILSINLIPYLKKHGLESLWIGSSIVIDSVNNPDKLRQCLISIRTILEYLIDGILAPKEEIKYEEFFEKEFKKYHSGKQDIDFVKIKREDKIKYFAAKLKDGYLDDNIVDAIKYICNTYSVLCNIHQPDIGLTENQVRSLKVRTGITIWMLLYWFEVVNEG